MPVPGSRNCTPGNGRPPLPATVGEGVHSLGPQGDEALPKPHSSPVRRLGTEAAVNKRTADEEYALRLQQEFDQEVAEKEARTRFQCPLCLEDSVFDRSVQLDCSHRTCQDCFFSYLEVKIREKCVGAKELCCPMPDCSCEVTVPQVEGAVRHTPLWERFLGARAELWRPDDVNEQLCVCPAPDCMRFVVPIHVKEATCPRCQASFCTKCGFQHPGKSCEAHAAWRRQHDAGERALEELIQQQGWQRCPVCQVACERDDGCNFMRCYSARCRGWSCFCYLCGKELAAIEHFMHYPEGACENVCANVDRRGDKNLPKAVPTNPELSQRMVHIHRMGHAISGLLRGNSPAPRASASGR